MVDRKAPPLPAPTETDTTTPTEATTDVSKPGDDETSYSLPDDGTPVTIRTRGHKPNRSQTSLLIEYYEGGKGASSGTTERRPSVRVRLTPSKKAKGDHIQVTETKGSRKASMTRRIPLHQATSRELDLPAGDDAHSMESYASATEESNVSKNPIDIEIDRPHRRRRPASPLIPSAEPYQPGNPSEISAIPTDSFLDGTGPSGDVKRSSSPSHHAGALAAAAGAGALAGVALDEIRHGKTRSSGKERVKITDKNRDKSDRKRRTKSRTSSLSEQGDDVRSPRRRSSRTHQESAVSGADSSILSSNLSPSHRSLDEHSMRSGTSKSSINNPKLLLMVEDSIRRLILPELSALKREQSKREDRRGSLTSTGTSGSREVSRDRRRSSGQRGESARDGAKYKERRNREARHDYGDGSPRSVSRASVNDEYATNDGEDATPKRSGDFLKAAAAGAVLGAGLSALDDKSQSEDRRHRERRRRRAESGRSRSLGRERYEEEYDDDHLAPAPPMPLMSDINPSEMTRTSILSADSDGPHSATEEMAPIRDVSRGMLATAASTPTPSRTPVNMQQLGTSHANVSHGDLTALPRGNRELAQEYEADEFGRKVPVTHPEFDEEPRPLSEPGDYPDQGFEEDYYNTQDVPSPLKYVPYQAGARGLSPIPSVSGYTDDGGNGQHPRYSRSLASVDDGFPSPERYPENTRQLQSTHSLNSIPSNMRSRDFDQISADGRSLKSAGADYQDAGYGANDGAAPLAAGQAVRGIAANPNIVHQPTGVESAVASLVDGSLLDQSVLTSGSGYEYAGPQGSSNSYDDHSRSQSSRDISPEKMSARGLRELEEGRHATPSSRSQDQSQEYSEYEIDEHGRKVPRSRYRHSPTASEAAITVGAVGAAAAALKAAQERNKAHARSAGQEDFQPAGVARNKSFKERAMEGWEPRNTPAHSIDRFDYDEQPKMSSSGLPDVKNPMPEVGYVDDDLLTNPSVVEDRLDGQRDVADLSGRATPTQRDISGIQQDVIDVPQDVRGKDDGTPRRGLGITEVAGVAALGAAAGMVAAHSREPSQDIDEWHRTSDDRKRDTLVTNPFEDASPIANPALNDNLLEARGLNTSYNAPYNVGSPGFGQKYDEGYMSNDPVRSPDIQPKGKASGVTGVTGVATGDDPFYEPKNHARHLSGMSQGMASPFYDAATGAGIERIESKDIVALMQHLMVRDAQRSARDTEIVALLMNAALEMRNNFREMKEFIQDTGDDVIFANSENTDKLQKAINGPRPYPGVGSRSLQSGSQTGTLDDVAGKKKNLWKRALQGLSTKGTNDLTRIEDMLMQLLGEVDVLKTQTAQDGPGQSAENLQPEGQYEQDAGYEPEGISTASHASHSGHLSLPLSGGPSTRLGAERKFSDHRISTVPEHDEERQYDGQSPAVEQRNPDLLSPGLPDAAQRGASVPLDTPPQPAAPAQMAPLSAENTPRSDRGKKHKSSSSSGWIPKISRWSETTASSVGKALRGSGGKKKYEDYQPHSRSGSSLASYDEHYHHDPYGEDKLHSGFSEPNLRADNQASGALPAPEIARRTPEDPKYKAHRNSLNLQHPQPRPGQTERFRTALEYSAQEYNTPMTPRSADWAGSATSLNRLPPANTNRYSNTSSTAARDAEYWPSSPTAQAAPPRPPKEPMDSPATQTPPRSSRVSKLQKTSPGVQQGYEGGYGALSGTQAARYSGSPRLENRNLSGALSVPTRKPSGPREMTPKSPEEDAAREERRRKRDTFGTVASGDTDTF